MTTCVQREFKHWHVDEMLLSKDKQVIVLELLGWSFPGKNLMIMLTDYGFYVDCQPSCLWLNYARIFTTLTRIMFSSVVLK